MIGPDLGHGTISPFRSVAMNEHNYALEHTQVEQQEVSRVLRNTYGLLAITLAFSGLVAFIAQRANVPYPNIFVVLIGFYGLFFLTAKLRNSAWGLVSTLALTGFMGYTLGPIINRYLSLPNGGEIVMLAMAGTAAIFFALSAYALIKKTNFSFSFIGNYFVISQHSFWLRTGAICFFFCRIL